MRRPGHVRMRGGLLTAPPPCLVPLQAAIYGQGPLGCLDLHLKDPSHNNSEWVNACVP